MTRKAGCGDCEDGQLFVFFKNPHRQTVRTDYYYCAICHPSARSSVGPESGEEEISQTEFFDLLDKGWDDPDI
jgi:hypothetical protein